LSDIATTLREQRGELLDGISAIATPVDLISFQLRLVDAIREAERHRREKVSEIWRWHIRLLRIIGDALAWLYLDPHSIRSLGRDQNSPPSLVGQGADFDFVLTTAAESAERGLVTLICDVTNCLQIGDVVVVSPAGELLLVECKNTPRRRQRDFMRGRLHRQISRGVRVAEYLSTGTTSDDSDAEDVPQWRAMTINHPIKHSWDALRHALNQAEAHGYGAAAASSHDIVLAWDVNQPLPSEVIPMEMMGAFTGVAWASHFDLVEFPRPRQQPPILWPLSFSQRHALLEGELRVMHLIDPSVFLGGGDGAEEPRAVEILDRDDGLGVLVRYAGQEVELTPRFIEDILLGFQSIEDTRSQALAFVKEVLDNVEAGETSTGPGVTYVTVLPSLSDQEDDDGDGG
jgi:hypothetical protein